MQRGLLALRRPAPHLERMSEAVERLNAALEGRYRIESELGEGGMATVYLADDIKHERKVALKVLKPELAAVVGAERFLAEIKTTANRQQLRIADLLHKITLELGPSRSRRRCRRPTGRPTTPRLLRHLTE